MYCYTYIFFIVFKIVEQFQKRDRLQRSVNFIAEYCLIFNLWASRVLVYSGRNLWIVDLCSVDLRLWNWKGVDEVINSMAILQGGMNFIIQVFLWAHITDLGCRRQTFTAYSRLVMFHCGTGCVMI